MPFDVKKICFKNLCIFLTRIYRGYSLLPSITDITMENNLSRVVAAVSHELITSTTRALTVSLLPGPCMSLWPQWFGSV